MADLTCAFGIYENEEAVVAAVDELTASGFRAETIMVLHPDTEASRDFALRAGTSLPAAIADRSVTGLPLEGSWGLLYPGEGPVQGALPTALADMGAPPEWSANTVRDGKSILSVACTLPDSLLMAETILRAEVPPRSAPWPDPGGSSDRWLSADLPGRQILSVKSQTTLRIFPCPHHYLSGGQCTNTMSPSRPS